MSDYPGTVAAVFMLRDGKIVGEHPDAVMKDETTYYPHYTSTYCIHGDHSHCRMTCKTCGSQCLCQCHKPKVDKAEYARLPAAPKRIRDDAHLTPREVQVSALIAEGKTSKEIARELGISFRTVVCHRGRILHKTGMRNAAALTRYALQEGLVREKPASKAETV
jgi:DNA-binding CsgD family transcriptional regulator